MVSSGIEKKGSVQDFKNISEYDRQLKMFGNGQNIAIIIDQDVDYFEW